MESRGSGLFLILLLLAAAAGAVLVGEDLAQRRRQARAEEFQRLVGGVGFGPALDLSGCAFGFDPRLDGGCAEERGPVPGGACFCPRHAGSVLFYAPLERGQPLPVEGGDETSP
ncbi:MAG TPA: hypothetical protein VKA46_31545 [Gemmataceae bacterium]|nr:hypothetical protein [Gemmataceae bacterium]